MPATFVSKENFVAGDEWLGGGGAPAIPTWPALSFTPASVSHAATPVTVTVRSTGLSADDVVCMGSGPPAPTVFPVTIVSPGVGTISVDVNQFAPTHGGILSWIRQLPDGSALGISWVDASPYDSDRAPIAVTA